MKCVILEEKNKKYNADEICGIELGRNKKEITVVGIKNNRDETVIRERVLSLKDFLVQPLDKDDVEHAFKRVLICLENKVNDATFALMDAEKSLKDSKLAYKKQFGKEPSYI